MKPNVADITGLSNFYMCDSGWNREAAATGSCRKKTYQKPFARRTKGSSGRPLSDGRGSGAEGREPAELKKRTFSAPLNFLSYK